MQVLFCLPGLTMNNSNSIYYQGCTSCRCFCLVFLKFSGFGNPLKRHGATNVVRELLPPPAALLQVGLSRGLLRDRRPLEVRAGDPSSPEEPPPAPPHFPLMEGPEPYGMRRMPLRVRRPFVLEQETI